MRAVPVGGLSHVIPLRERLDQGRLETFAEAENLTRCARLVIPCGVGDPDRDAYARSDQTPAARWCITGDADVATLEHSVAMFRLLGGGIMGDMGQPLPASRFAVLPATSHNAVITQPEPLLGFIEPFLRGETPKGFFQDSSAR